MHRFTILRISLLALMAAAGTAILISFLSRRSLSEEEHSAAILAPDISRRTTQFEYAEHKRGRTVFKVYAETSTETVDGLHELREVRLAYHDSEGRPTDSISGKEAVYEIAKKAIEFKGNVTIRLANGTEVFSNRVRADLEREVVIIEDNFRFQRQALQGEGASLEYRIPERVLRVGGRLALNFAAESESARAAAGSGVYWLERQLIELQGEARLSQQGARLRGERMQVHMSAEDRIRQIVSSQNAELQLPPQGTFRGSRIDAVFEPISGGLDRFEVMGRPAQLAGLMQARPYWLTANRIDGFPDSRPQLSGAQLQRLEAEGEVFLRLPQLGVEDARCRRLEGHFFEQDRHLRLLRLEGAVQVRRRVPEDSGAVQSLRSGTLEFHFHPDRWLRQIQAMQNVDLEIRRSGEVVHLEARESLEVRYHQGEAVYAAARGEGRLERDISARREALRGNLLEAHFEHGLLKRFSVRETVGLMLEEAGQQRYTASDKLDVAYGPAGVKEAVQTGNFRYWEGEPVTLELKSEQARWYPEPRKIHLKGRQPSVLRLENVRHSSRSETMADEFWLDEQGNQIEASGRVRTVFPRESGLFIITADRMRAETQGEWVRYDGKARLNQDSGSVTGQVIRYQYGAGRLKVEGDVESAFREPAGESSPAYWIRAEHLTYEEGDERALYEGEVRVQTEQLLVEAPMAELLFSPARPSMLRQMVAWGGVRITEEGRRARGDRAVHFPSERKLVLTGQPAQIEEAEKGTATGRQLILYTGEERLVVEGPVQENP